MLSDDVKGILRRLFDAALHERGSSLATAVQQLKEEMADRGILGSSITEQRMRTLYADELKLRTRTYWEILQRTLSEAALPPSDSLGDDLKGQLYSTIDNQTVQLATELHQELASLSLGGHGGPTVQDERDHVREQFTAEVDLFVAGFTSRGPLLHHSRELPAPLAPGAMPGKAKNPKAVFVVHGRNEALRRSLFDFLRSLSLEPIEWSQAVHATGKAAPYVGEVLDSAFAKAQAVVVLLSPDDEVRLSEFLWAPHEAALERTIQLQARPNVLFEAGMAFGTHPERTVLVQVGVTKPFSDIAGRHVVRLNNSPERRAELAERLRQAGCPVDTSGHDWMSAGDFDVPLQPTSWPPIVQDPPRASHSRPELHVSMGILGAWRREQIVIENVGQAVARDIVVSADGAPIDQHPCWVSGQTLPDKLRPGEKLGVKIALSMGSPERTEVSVTWKDEQGSEYETERTLQLM